MAVTLIFRAALALGAAGTRVVRWAEGPGADSLTSIPRTLWDRLADPGESDADLEVALSDATGTVSAVDTFTDPFELRKCQVLFGRSSGAAAGTDDAVCTFHLIKLVGGVPSANWAAADFQVFEGEFNAAWAAILANWPNETTLKQYRWYKAGPQIAPPQPPVRIVDVATPGGSAAGAPQAPQVAVSITEKTTDPKSWGRFYLPTPVASVLLPDSARLNGAVQGLWADTFDTMYQDCITGGTPIVVYSTAKPERETADGTVLPARAARALPVKQIQVDDVLDVIRSRRWNEPLLRLQRDIAGS